MPHLKKKIQLASSQRNKILQSKSPFFDVKISKTKPFNIIRNPVKKAKKPEPKKVDQTISKNIVKNYGKAMSAFAASDLAKPYLEDLAQIENIDQNKFLEFMATYKESTDSIDSLRHLLIVSPDDPTELAAYKRIFKRLCEIFLKYLSVNWIFHGKMFHKMHHLKYRYKMLRRVRKPELFTYLTAKIK